MTDDLSSAAAAIRAGAIVGVPTDTVYGLAVDPLRPDSLEELYELKGRPMDNPIPLLAANLADARRFGVIDIDLSTHWPGALTVVVSRVAGVPHWVGDPSRGTVALRVPDHPIALRLLGETGPLAVTSANRSGQDPAPDHSAAAAVFGDRVAAYLSGAGAGTASTVVDLTGPEPRVLRSGPVAWSP